MTPLAMIKTALLALAGLFTLVAAGATYVALVAPTHSGAPFTLAAAENRRATQALGQTPPDTEAATQATERALAQAPYDPSAWLRLAYIDAADGALGPEGLQALERSYQLRPFDHYVAVWRVRFALEHWGDLTPAIRAAVKSETLAFTRTSRYPDMIATLAAVENPIGRLPAAIWRAKMREERARMRARRAELMQSGHENAQTRRQLLNHR
ncbi:MAG: hypothetical protein Q7S93_00540 [Phenylobacterium sp.]|uniref:hypothetical protein n=1 Tax=Phenylobacterium sp. TaxID=1871053 RepID=UPI00271F2C13|nr:hypothetical protein [Phenylobacterium sp.]MDO8408542.1 hypothetical protein [Phenylobacterium sp.]